MLSNPRVFELLEEMLNSGRMPEEVCADCPELLPEVQRRWQTFRLIDEEVAALLPDSATRRDSDGVRPFANTGELPQIPGYRVDGVLGSGGMGVVYRAWDPRLNRPIALKMLLAGAQARPTELERFQREAQAVAALRHPNIVQVYDVGQVGGRPYFTMEFVEGRDLAETIQGNPQPASKAATVVAILADAIHVAHQSGIVHRDLKPSNVLLAADGTPKVTDFGLARRLEGEKELTLSGSPMGTPSYMAPEQARGDKHAVGPATDVYALGAILYELLTGRPPFRAETPTATLHQVITDDPVSPARLNPRVPRDLDTICLKCLHKEPHRRYETAAALAEDLRRFEQGEPVKARRVGPMERAARWAWRRPALAGSLATGVLLACTLIGTIIWWHGQRTALEATAVAYAEADLTEAERLRDRGEFKASAEVLRRAKDRLREFVPPELHDRLQAAFDNLELVTRLDAIRQERALVKSPTEFLGVLVLPVNELPKEGRETQSGRHYEEAFREAGIGAPGDDPGDIAARIQASPVRGALVAALDDWAACAADRDQLAWVLAVVRQADPDPWRDRVRDPATWDNPAALRELAARAPVAEQSPQLLAVLGARLRAKNLNAVPFLAPVMSAYPSDFWVNIEMGNSLYLQSNLVEAVGYYRTALALRPQTLSLRYALGDLYAGLKRWDEAIAEYERAVHLYPANAWCHNRLGFALAWKGGRDDEAIAHTREAVRIDPNMGWFHYCLGFALDRKDCFDEAAAELREAIRLLPEKRAEWRRDLRFALLRRGRAAEARDAWKEDLAARPPKHDDWFGYAELCLFLGDEAEYRRARLGLLAQFGSATDPNVAERTGRACLLLPAPKGEFEQAVALTDRAVAAQSGNPFYLFAQGLARYRQGRVDDAIKLMNGGAAPVMGPCPRVVLAMAQHQNGQKDQARKTLAAAIASNDWTPAKATNHDVWIAHILRREAEAMIMPEGPMFLDGKK
jgi:eukaryotic-like serine/threonine-protein kinase